MFYPLLDVRSAFKRRRALLSDAESALWNLVEASVLGGPDPPPRRLVGA
ncbi:hypothetical protein CASFOL_017174 [Castilleja foliolosa]|uniref:Uncharacterized protein n=1 Tax=Castilleja foliolosa TaxID=1961234 RepID=A0ABD3DB97_9LAMI